MKDVSSQARLTLDNPVLNFSGILKVLASGE